MSEQVDRRMVAVVAGLAAVAGLALVNPFTAAVMWTHGAGYGTPPDFWPVFPVIGVFAALAVVAGLLVLQRARSAGWVWLLLAGTVLSLAAAQLFTGTGVAPVAIGLGPFGTSLAMPAMGAGPVLVILGLLGAGDWLMRAAGVAAAVPALAAAFVAPLLGGPLFALVLGGGLTLPGLGRWVSALALAGCVAAAALTLLTPVLRRAPRSDEPPVRLSAAGMAAGFLLLVPTLSGSLGGAEGIRTEFDLTGGVLPPNDVPVLRIGLTGLVLFVVALGLAASLGFPVLGAVLGAGLLTYGVLYPVNYFIAPLSDPVVGLLCLLGGAALGGIAAATRWRAWFAGAACLLVAGASVLAATGPDGHLDPPLAQIMLGAAMFALVTGIVAVGAQLCEQARMPAVLGVLAPLVQASLIATGALARHSLVAGPEQTAGRSDILGIAGAVALLFAGLLVISLPRLKAPTAGPEPAAPAEPNRPEPVPG